MDINNRSNTIYLRFCYYFVISIIINCICWFFIKWSFCPISFLINTFNFKNIIWLRTECIYNNWRNYFIYFTFLFLIYYGGKKAILWWKENHYRVERKSYCGGKETHIGNTISFIIFSIKKNLFLNFSIMPFLKELKKWF